VLGREALPLRFVASLSPRTLEEVTARLSRVPGLQLKLDASPRWTDALLRELGRSGAVEVVDFKGAPGDPEHLELLERVLEHLPGVLLEDPPAGAEAETILERAAASVALDAGMLTPADLERAGPRVVAVSAKPARVGSLGAHLALVEAALARGLRVHGGGRFELGVGRRQLQALAALLHPDAPNDLAPVEHHAREGAGPLPASPLAVSVGVPGFGAM
jgi:O-succinylbenzoate synthase